MSRQAGHIARELLLLLLLGYSIAPASCHKWRFGSVCRRPMSETKAVSEHQLHRDSRACEDESRFGQPKTAPSPDLQRLQLYYL